MLIRVRSNVGEWRVDGLDEKTATVSDVQAKLKETRPDVEFEKALSGDPGCQYPLDTSLPLSAQGMTHGSRVHCRVNPETCAEVTTVGVGSSAKKASNASSSLSLSSSSSLRSSSGSGPVMKRVVASDGSIQMVQNDERDSKGFRKGQMALRDMKMQWTLNDFVALDSQFEFKIKRQPEAACKGVSLDTPSVQDFQNYLRRFQFSRQRCGYLYGKYVRPDGSSDETKTTKTPSSASASATSTATATDSKAEPLTKTKVVVEAIYEPPQEADPDSPEGFHLLEDPKEDKVERLAQMLGLEKVGWIVGHPPREEGFVLSAHEIITAAELQLEASQGADAETPFVTVRVTVGEDGNTQVEAFQVSQQCMQMVAEEALEVGPQPGFCNVNETFSAIQEGKQSKTVDNNFFLTVVPIVQHTSDLLVCQFPKANRDHEERIPSKQELKRQLTQSGTAGWTFTDLLADFHLLMYLTQFLDLETDFPKICASLVNREQQPLDDGYKLIIAGVAGLDHAY